MTRLSDGDDSPVVCAGCGTVDTAPGEWPFLPAGWTADSFGEFCPACSKGTPEQNASLPRTPDTTGVH